MNTYEYEQEVASCAESIAVEAMDQANNDIDDAQELIQDALLHETIDGHEWIIYTYHHAHIALCSDNEDAYKDIYCAEDLGSIIMDKGLEEVQMIVAFWAFYQDVSDKIAECLAALAQEEEETC